MCVNLLAYTGMVFILSSREPVYCNGIDCQYGLHLSFALSLLIGL